MKKKISILYHHFPHYRAPVMRALSKSKKHQYDFYGSTDDFEGIKAFKGDDFVTINPILFTFDNKGKMDISGYEKAISNDYDATIIIGNINMKGTWKAQKEANRNGLKTLYWAHGWLKKENFIKAKVRNYYFKKADKVLTYGSRAKVIATSTGFNPSKIQVIWNSLDFTKQTEYFEKYKDIERFDLRNNIGMPNNKIMLLTISRVTDICHYEWLIDAVAYLKNSKNLDCEIWMIGEGPALNGLIELAKDKNVKLNCQGALYDEELIAQHLMSADIVVSPGKLGLTGMHALAYGTPVVTHGNFDLQMPEVEAVIEGQSGVFFKYGDPTDLANKISEFLPQICSYNSIRDICRNSLIGRFTPEDQARLIDEAIDEVLNED
ncbi:glycosyltransferase [Acinetobacter sp. YH16040_T]|uniref:glycosyltransferase family 4 protein n=1 Tax=unclassified Acinetobacter TaxID=196816 RepID=UPI0015D1B4EC|nr:MULTISPECIES: glycosyltransferase [unclassified Acinetobacter]UUS57563.1 glycosyltransferase [Acinetobacter sp. YH16040_T]